jgi:hypothetical protein
LSAVSAINPSHYPNGAVLAGVSLPVLNTSALLAGNPAVVAQHAYVATDARPWITVSDVLGTVAPQLADTVTVLGNTSLLGAIVESW